MSENSICNLAFPNLVDVVLYDNSLFLSKIMPSLVSLLYEISFLLILFLHIFFDNSKILPIIFAKYGPFKAFLLQLVESEFACNSHICLNVVCCLAGSWLPKFIFLDIEFSHGFLGNAVSWRSLNRVDNFFNQNLGVIRRGCSLGNFSHRHFSWVKIF